MSKLYFCTTFKPYSRAKNERPIFLVQRSNIQAPFVLGVQYRLMLVS